MLFGAGARRAAVPLQRCWATTSRETPSFTVSRWVRRVARRLLGGYEPCELTADERRSRSAIPSETCCEMAVFGESGVLAANRGLGVRVPPSARLFPQVSTLCGVPGGRLGPSYWSRGRNVGASRPPTTAVRAGKNAAAASAAWVDVSA